MNYDLNGAIEVTTNFVKGLGYSTGSMRIDLARFDEETQLWCIHVNFGIITTKIRVVVIDDKTGDVIGFDRPPLSLAIAETPINLVQIPYSLIDSSAWGAHVYYYALSRSALGISPTQIKEWNEVSLFKSSKKRVEKGADTINLMIPDSLVNFYELPNSETELVGLGDSVILSIKSNIITVDRPQD